MVVFNIDDYHFSTSSKSRLGFYSFAEGKLSFARSEKVIIVNVRGVSSATGSSRIGIGNVFLFIVKFNNEKNDHDQKMVWTQIILLNN